MKIDDAARLRVPRQVAWPGRRPAPPGDRPGRPGTRGGPGGLLLDLLLAAALLAVTAWAVALPARAVATQLGWRGIAAVYVASACRQIPSPDETGRDRRLCTGDLSTDDGLTLLRSAVPLESQDAQPGRPLTVRLDPDGAIVHPRLADAALLESGAAGLAALGAGAVRVLGVRRGRRVLAIPGAWGFCGLGALSLLSLALALLIWLVQLTG